MGISRKALTFFVVALLASCGGGGGNDGDEDPLVLPVPTGRVEGRITFIRPASPPVVDLEPNNSVGEAQPLPDAFVGDTRSIFGRLDAASDTTDAYRLRIPYRAQVSLSLTKAAANDFDLALYDPVSMQFIALADDSTPSFLVTFQGTLDLVVSAASGAGIYELAIAVEATLPDLPEYEPNDTPQSAAPFGEVRQTDAIRIIGDADAAADPVDMLLVLAPDQGALQFRLEMDDTTRCSLRVSDATAGVGGASELTTLSGPGSEARTGQVVVAAGTLLLLEVLADSGSGAWALRIAGGQSGGASKPTLAGAAIPHASCVAALDAEAGVRPGCAPYGTLAGPCMPGEAIVAYVDGCEEAGDALVRRRGCAVTRALPGVYCRISFPLPPGADEAQCQRASFARAALLASGSCIRFAEPNHIRHGLATTPNDPWWSRQQWNYEMIDLPNAWDISTGSSDVIVAVIDSGSMQHPDLDARWTGGYDFVTVPTWARDGDGLDPDPTDIDAGADRIGGYHGSGVASVIGARTNDGYGMAGVTWATRIMPIRVLGTGNFGTDVEVVEGIRFAARLTNSSNTLPPERADVINMSLAGAQVGAALGEACAAAKEAGCILVAAAGNSGNTAPLYPAAYDSTISVGAVGANRRPTRYSNYGPTLDLMAPGGDTAVDLNGDGFGDGVWLVTGWPGPGGTTGTAFHWWKQGTSYAAPHVAGVAALILAVDPTLDPDEVETILKDSAVDMFPPGRDDNTGHGLLNARRALEIARGPVPPPPPAPPALRLSPPVLSFGVARTDESAYVFNDGVDPLVVTGLEISTADGQAWLTATLEGPGDSTRNTDRVRVQVERAGLTEGNYFGEVTVRSNGGDVTVPILVEVVQSLPPPPNLPIFVQAISVETGEVVAEVSVNPVVNLDFVFAALPVGDYVFRASSDVDGDGTTCEVGDFCGGFPVREDLRPRTVVRGFTLKNIDFSVQRDAVPIGR